MSAVLRELLGWRRPGAGGRRGCWHGSGPAHGEVAATVEGGGCWCDASGPPNAVFLGGPPLCSRLSGGGVPTAVISPRRGRLGCGLAPDALPHVPPGLVRPRSWAGRVSRHTPRGPFWRGVPPALALWNARGRVVGTVSLCFSLAPLLVSHGTGRRRGVALRVLLTAVVLGGVSSRTPPSLRSVSVRTSS